MSHVRFIHWRLLIQNKTFSHFETKTLLYFSTKKRLPKGSCEKRREKCIGGLIRRSTHELVCFSVFLSNFCQIKSMYLTTVAMSVYPNQVNQTVRYILSIIRVRSIGASLRHFSTFAVAFRTEENAFFDSCKSTSLLGFVACKIQ